MITYTAVSFLGNRSAEIAQLVEHFTRNEGVVGSSPIFSFPEAFVICIAGGGRFFVLPHGIYHFHAARSFPSIITIFQEKVMELLCSITFSFAISSLISFTVFGTHPETVLLSPSRCSKPYGNIPGSRRYHPALTADPASLLSYLSLIHI